MTNRILTPAEVGEIRERASKATEGTWKLWGMQVRSDPIGDSDLDHSWLICDTHDPHRGARTFNADFIAHSRVDVPALCDTIEALRGECERLKSKVGGDICEVCGLDPEDDVEMVARLDDGRSVCWVCIKTEELQRINGELGAKNDELIKEKSAIIDGLTMAINSVMAEGAEKDQTIKAALGDIAALTRDLDEAGGMMKVCEWGFTHYNAKAERLVHFCPSCLGAKSEGHDPDCRLAAWLKKQEGGDAID